MAEEPTKDQAEQTHDEPSHGGAKGTLGALGCASLVSLPLTICIVVVLFLLILWLGRVYIWAG